MNVTYQGNLNYYDNESISTFTNINKDKQIYRYSTRTNGSDGEGFGHNTSVSYTHKAKNPAEFVRVILNANFNKNNNDRGFFQEFLQPDMSPTGIDSTQSQFFDNYNRSLSARVDYNKPLKKKGSNFSTGVTYNRSYFHNSLNTSFLRKSDSLFIPNDLLSNDFEFRQDIFTARAGFGLQFSKGWRINMGVQAEHTATEFTFFKGNSANVNNGYWNFLPNFTLRKEFNKILNTSLVYRATIRRPGIGELNPNVDYSDPYNLRFGNPYLRPTLSDNFDWNLSWIKGKYYINTSIGYNRLRDVFNSIRNLVGGGKTEVSWLNIADRREYEASIWGGYTGAVSERQPPMYFRLGGGTVKGVSKPGEIVWSRVFVDAGILKADLGRAKVVELPQEETQRRWDATTPQWPIMHAVLAGVTRDQLMARHKANHINVAYAPTAEDANRALAAKAAMFREMGLDVFVCGTGHGLES